MGSYMGISGFYLLKDVNKRGKLLLSTTKKTPVLEAGRQSALPHPPWEPEGDREWPCIPACMPVHSWLCQSSCKMLTIWNSKWEYHFLLFSLSLFREMIVNHFLGPSGLQLLFFVILGFLFTLQLYFCGLLVLWREVLCVTGYDKNDISYFIYPGFYSDFLGLL